MDAASISAALTFRLHDYGIDSISSANKAFRGTGFAFIRTARSLSRAAEGISLLSLDLYERKSMNTDGNALYSSADARGHGVCQGDVGN